MQAANPPGVMAPNVAHESVTGVAAMLWRKKFWIIIPTLVAFFGALAFVNSVAPKYKGEARVLLENRETIYSRPDKDSRVQDPQIDSEAVASQVQNIMSKDLALKVIRDMDLTKRAEFDSGAKGPGLVGGLLIGFGLSRDPRLIPQEERVLETFQKRMLVFPQGKSRVISIEFQSEDPKLAADIANRIAEEFLRREESAKKETGKVTSEWLDRAIEPLMKRSLAAEAKVEAFRSSKGLFVGANNMNITSQQLAELNTQLTTARSTQADLNAKAKLIREALRLGRVFETSEVNNNELVRRLLEQRAALRAQIAFEERTLLPGHPRMKELSSQLRDLESQVRSAAERAARALENDARTAGLRVQTLQTELDGLKKRTALSNEDEVQLKALERDALALREQLNSYRNKFLDAAARTTEGVSPADGRVISRAVANNDPIFPKKLPIVLLATLGTAVISAALIASSAMMARPAPFAPGMPGQPAPGFGDFPAPPGPQGGRSRQAGRRTEPHTAPASAPPQPRKGLVASLIALAKREPQDGAAIADAPAIAQGAPHHHWTDAYREAPNAVQVPAGPISEPQAHHGAEAVEALVNELALLGYLGRGKVVVVHGAESDSRTSLHAMRFARRFSKDGAAVVIDVNGTSDLYTRLVGREAEGLSHFLDQQIGLGDIIHRDPRSRAHVVPAGMALRHRAAGPYLRETLEHLVQALGRSYAYLVIDAGAIGGMSEALAAEADAVVLITRQEEETAFLRATATRMESLRGAPVFLVHDDGVIDGAPETGTPRSFGLAKAG